MTRTNAKEIAVATYCKDREVRACHLHTLGNRQRTSMHAMEAKCADKVWEPAGAANPRDDNRLIHWPFEGSQRRIGGIEYTKVATAGTPGRLYIAFKIFWRQGNGWLRHD
jgi:hypothetical protein